MENAIEMGKWKVVVAEIEGFRLLVPTTYLEADPKEVDEKTGGCGPGKFGDYLVMDNLLGENIFLACRIHDWTTGEAETEEDKYWSDLLFLNNMVLIVNDGEWLDPPRCKMAMSYYIAVSFMGGKYAKNVKED